MRVWTSPSGPPEQLVQLATAGGQAPAVPALAKDVTLPDVLPDGNYGDVSVVSGQIIINPSAVSTGKIAPGAVDNTRLAAMAPGTVKGLQVDAPGSAAPVDLTGREQGESVRTATVMTTNRAGVAQTLALAADATMLDKTAGSSVSWASFTGGSDGRVIALRHTSGGGSSTTLEHDSGVDGFLCPGAVPFQYGGNASAGLGGNTAVAGYLLYLSSLNRWLVIPRGINRAELVTWSGLHNFTAGLQLNGTAILQALRGTGLTAAANVLQPVPRFRRIVKSDFFVGGTTASGSIGELGWKLSGTGAFSYAKATNDIDSPARQTINTAAGINDWVGLFLGETPSTGFIRPAAVERLQFIWNSASSGSRRIFMGLTSDVAADPLTVSDSLGFVYDTGVGGNWLVINRAAGVGAPFDSGIAFASNVSTMMSIYQNPATLGSYEMRFNETLITTLAAGVSNANMNVAYRLQTLAASGIPLRVGGLCFVSQLIGGAYDNDNFLEN